MSFLSVNGSKIFDEYALVGEHLLVFGHDVVCDFASVQVVGLVGDFKTAFLKVLEAVLEKFIVVGLETNLKAILEEGFVDLELCGVGKSSFVVLATGPGIAEVYVEPSDVILRRDDLEELVNIVCGEHNVFGSFVFFLKDFHDVSAGNAQHIAFDVNSNEVCVGITECFLSNKGAFAAAYFKLNGV